jgi:SAM-dependent methyltransferase
MGPLLRAVRRRLRPPPPPPEPITFDARDIDEICRVYRECGGSASPAWEPYRHAHMVLPEWFEQGLDPWGPAYAEQQHRLWRLMAGVERDYEPEVDETEFGWEGVDPVRQPGFYRRRDAQAIHSASDHLLAMGMLLRHCQLQPGDWALEYGAGFGQSALALARLGVQVDTVDISVAFCSFIQAQAEFFRVPLHAHQGQFGHAPQPGRRYRLIWFYESFHHCVDFMRVVGQLGAMLEPGGRVILHGEPIVEQPYAAVPYPWGVRLHSEVAAVVRQTRWFELGFTEAFLYELFGRHGFLGTRIECPPSLFGRLYVFEQAQAEGVA